MGGRARAVELRRGRLGSDGLRERPTRRITSRRLRCLQPGHHRSTQRRPERTDRECLRSDQCGQPATGQTACEWKGIWYTPASGIWQTVWLEPVPAAYITGLKLTPDLDQQAVQLLVNGEGLDAHTIAASVWHSGTLVASATGSVSSPITISIPAPHPWSPDDPFLYDVQVDLKLGATVVDHVEQLLWHAQDQPGADRPTRCDCCSTINLYFRSAC